MSSVLDLNKNEIKVLLTSLYNFNYDKDFLDFYDQIHLGTKNTLENLISKFENTIEG